MLKCSFTPISTQESSTGLAMSGSVAIDSAHGRGVDEVGLDPAVGERGHHLQAERARLEHDGRLRTESRTLSHSIASRMFFT